jgi:hypothetical protein
MLHTYVQTFDVTGNLEIFRELNMAVVAGFEPMRWQREKVNFHPEYQEERKGALFLFPKKEWYCNHQPPAPQRLTCTQSPPAASDHRITITLLSSEGKAGHLLFGKSGSWVPLYSLLAKLIRILLGTGIHNAFKWLWRSSCQNKHKFFFWLLLKDRLSTRALLRRRNMHLPDYNCVLYGLSIEGGLVHLLFHCSFSVACSSTPVAIA